MGKLLYFIFLLVVVSAPFSAEGTNKGVNPQDDIERLSSFPGSFATKVSTGSQFPCVVNKSLSTPTSVHKLRPSDIKVVAAIGDSLTAGMGIYSSSVISIFTQYRGHSFTMGGEDPLSRHTTLPNILKEFNPNLIGYSTGIGGPDGKNAHLNVAVVGDRAEAMPGQARKLVERMKATQGIDFKNDWKVINLFIGGNDICDYCKFPDRFAPEKYKQYIIDALEYLEANVPRAFVNLVEVLDASSVNELKEKSLVCKALLSSFWCKCGANRPKEEVRKYSLSLQRVTQEIMQDPNRFNKRDDFTVVLQPFLRKTNPPTLPDGSPDLAYFAPDCFHFSALGHASAAIGLWNNMVQPINAKDIEWDLNAKIACPTSERPYLATAKNL